MIDEMVVKNCKRRLTLLGIEWIDYCKVGDMVRHKELTAGGPSLGNVKIRQGIFQRNSLSPLLLLLTMIPLTLLLSKTKIPYQLKK